MTGLIKSEILVHESINDIDSLFLYSITIAILVRALVDLQSSGIIDYAVRVLNEFFTGILERKPVKIISASEAFLHQESSVLNCLCKCSRAESTKNSCSVMFIFEPRNMKDVDNIMKNKGDIHKNPWEMRGERRQVVYELLLEHMRQTQQEMVSLLSFVGVHSYNQFWIVNGISVQLNLLQYQQLCRLRSQWKDVFLDNIPMPIAPSFEFSMDKRTNSVDSIFNIEGAWKRSVNMGRNVTVAIVDYGINYLHPYISNSYRGCNRSNDDNSKNYPECSGYTHDYNWFDASTNNPSEYPKDSIGHGTEVVSLVTGYSHVTQDTKCHTLGVAPNAKWISARVADSSSAGIIYDSYLKISQWVLCPFPISSKYREVDCYLGADIVSNSWNFVFDSTELHGNFITMEGIFNSISSSYDAAGTFLVFSMGNNGHAGFRTWFSPLAYINNSIITVSSISNSGEPGDSTRGFAPYKDPTVIPPKHPIVCALGERVTVAVSDGTIGIKSGASLATSFTSGVIALMLGDDPTLLPSDVQNVIISTSGEKFSRMSGLVQYAEDIFGSKASLVYGNGPIDPVALVQYARDRWNGFDTQKSCAHAQSFEDRYSLRETARKNITMEPFYNLNIMNHISSISRSISRGFVISTVGIVIVILFIDFHKRSKSLSIIFALGIMIYAIKTDAWINFLFAIIPAVVVISNFFGVLERLFPRLMIPGHSKSN